MKLSLLRSTFNEPIYKIGIDEQGFQEGFPAPNCLFKTFHFNLLGSLELAELELSEQNS